MPNIKPFNALLPAAHLQGKVVTRPLEDYSVGEAKLIASENDYSFLHLINPELDNPYLRGTRQELVFKKISENLDVFLDRQVLVRSAEPSMYIYRVSHHGLVQTGIWTITHIDDYLQGKIKKHEHTVERRERLLAEYLQQTRLDANPVLITYQAHQAVETLISSYTTTQFPILDFSFGDESKHQVWQVSAAEDLDLLVNAFKDCSCVYIADGHHRIASAAKLNATPYFTSVYMNTEEIKVLEFNRLVKGLGNLTAEELLHEIALVFELEKVGEAAKPAACHQIGMYLEQQWYLLRPKKGVYDEHDPVCLLDVSILQNSILGPLLGIEDPRTDARITFVGGRTSITELQKQVDNGLFEVAFTLFPVSVGQLIAVADADGIMPPKSTWVEPKFLVGLITHHLS